MFLSLFIVGILVYFVERLTTDFNLNYIKQRVISHFYNKSKKEIAMYVETADITFEETESELLALLEESADIQRISGSVLL